jgi:hypothetical protein
VAENASTTDADFRMAFAFLVQPVVTGLLAFALFPLVELSHRALHGGRAIDVMSSAVAFGGAAAIAGAFVTYFCAVPLGYWLRQRGAITRRLTLLIGAILGNVPLVVIAVLAMLFQGEGPPLPRPEMGSSVPGFVGVVVEVVRPVLLGSCVGLVSAAVFWSIAGASLLSETRATAER